MVLSWCLGSFWSTLSTLLEHRFACWKPVELTTVSELHGDWWSWQPLLLSTYSTRSTGQSISLEGNGNGYQPGPLLPMSLFCLFSRRHIDLDYYFPCLEQSPSPRSSDCSLDWVCVSNLMDTSIFFYFLQAEKKVMTPGQVWLTPVAPSCWLFFPHFLPHAFDLFMFLPFLSWTCLHPVAYLDDLMIIPLCVPFL